MKTNQITAQEASQITKAVIPQTFDMEMEGIFAEIKKSAELGKADLTIEMYHREDVVTKLKELGYTSWWSGMERGDSPKENRFLTISWYK